MKVDFFSLLKEIPNSTYIEEIKLDDPIRREIDRDNHDRIGIPPRIELMLPPEQERGRDCFLHIFRGPDSGAEQETYFSGALKFEKEPGALVYYLTEGVEGLVATHVGEVLPDLRIRSKFDPWGAVFVHDVGAVPKRYGDKAVYVKRL